MPSLLSASRALLTSIRYSWVKMVIGGVLIAPVVMYIRVFGSEISDTHSHWAEMGSAMSGIYGPILAVLTFFVLVQQIRLQAQTNSHMFQQAYIQEARADVEFYLSKLADLLESVTRHDVVLRMRLHATFAEPTIEELQSNAWKVNAGMIDLEFPQLQASWSALNIVLDRLKNEAGLPYEMQLHSAQQKAIALLSYRTCAALDNFLYCSTEGRIRYPYLFTTALTRS